MREMLLRRYNVPQYVNKLNIRLKHRSTLNLWRVKVMVMNQIGPRRGVRLQSEIGTYDTIISKKLEP
jgi:hypothetical protein